jgi:hypothetical protein
MLIIGIGVYLYDIDKILESPRMIIWSGTDNKLTSYFYSGTVVFTFRGHYNPILKNISLKLNIKTSQLIQYVNIFSNFKEICKNKSITLISSEMMEYLYNFSHDTSTI